MKAADIGSVESSVAVTWFQSAGDMHGERALFDSWEDLLIELYGGRTGEVRFRWYLHDRKTTSTDTDPGQIVVLLVNLEHQDSGWLKAQLSAGCAHIRLRLGRALVPVEKAHLPAFYSHLGDAVDRFHGIGAPLPSDVPCYAGPLIGLPPPPPPRQTKEEFLAACDERRHARAAAAAKADASRPVLQTAPRADARSQKPGQRSGQKGGSGNREQAADLGSAANTADKPENESVWCIMLPSMVVEPLALIMAGKCTLHGGELRYAGKVVGHFDGTREELEGLTGATAHRVLRHLLLSQQTSNHGELLGAVAGLAAACGVQNVRAKRALAGFAKLRLGHREPVLSVSAKSRAVGSRRALPFELHGPFASGYFSRNRTVNIDSGSRRLVPLPSDTPPTTSNDRAAAEMSLEMLALKWMRENGEYDDEVVVAPLHEWELARLAELSGMSLTHAKTKLFAQAWEGRLMLCEIDEIPHLGFYGSWLPEIFPAMRAGLFRTARARQNRRKAGQPR